MNKPSRLAIYKHGFIPLLIFVLTDNPAEAADIAFLAGYQADSDLEISTSDQWPPENLPIGNPGENVDMDDGSSWAISINTDFHNNPNQKVGLFYSKHSSEFGATAGLVNPSLDIAFLHFNGTNIYPQSDRLSYFVTAGIGAAYYKPDDATLNDVTRFSLQIGGGAILEITENLYIQLDARWLPTFFNSEASVFCSGGCTISVNSDSISQFQMNAGLMLRF